MRKNWLCLGILALGLGIYLFWSIDQLGPRGALHKKLFENKDAVADILPPPLYIVESYMLINRYFHSEDPIEKNRLVEGIKKQREEFITHQLFWKTSQLFDDYSNKEYLLRVFESGDKIYQLFFKLLVDLGANSPRTKEVLKNSELELLVSFEDHRKEIKKLVTELNKQQMVLLEHTRINLEKSRYIIFILILLFVLFSFMLGTKKIEFNFLNFEQLWLPLLVAIMSYWVYGQLATVDEWRFLDLVFVSFITVGVARLMYNRHTSMTDKILSSEQKYRELLQNYSTDIVARLESERKRISREIHDGIIQLLGSVKFRLESVKGKWRREAILQEVDYDRSLELLQTAINDLRRLCHELRPSLLDQVGLVEAMDSLIEDFEFRTNILVIADIELDDSLLTEPIRLELFRIFQEVLTNCEKHSNATEINVTIWLAEPNIKDSKIIFEVQDNGRGVPLNQIGLPINLGLGLINIQERVRTLNGSVKFFSSDSEGFQVSIKIPTSRGGEQIEEQKKCSFNVSG